jgi:AcrR family transcriptional regulator
VLHHFGTREELVTAVVERAVRRLENTLLDAFRSAGDGAPDGNAMLERVFDMLGRDGHARLIAWLFLTGRDAIDVKTARVGWRAIIDAVHARRTDGASREDTQFTVVLSALATFGQAVAGGPMLDMAGFAGDHDAPARFARWFATLLASHLGQPTAAETSVRGGRKRSRSRARGAT